MVGAIFYVATRYPLPLPETKGYKHSYRLIERICPVSPAAKNKPA